MSLESISRQIRIWEAALIVILLVLSSCSNHESHPSEMTSQNNPIVNQTIDEKSIYGLTYNQNILEHSPFNIQFESNVFKEDDTSNILKGKSRDNILEASIHYDPRDKQIYYITFSDEKLPLHVTKADAQILLDFTDNFDRGFVNYFDRNFKGIFEDEDKFIDDGKYLNKERGLCFQTNGDVALNNMDLKKHPEMRQQILDAGNLESITIINIKKSWADTSKAVEK